MNPPGLDAALLTTLLHSLGAHLEAQGESAAVVVVGGAALCLRGWVERTTHDVDVIAMVSGGTWKRPEISAQLAAAITRVARDFNLDDDWFNDMVAMQWKTGLPDGIQEGIDWIRFRGLHVALAGRQGLISLKLLASVDQWPESVHLQDLLALAPTEDELERAERWVVEQDLAPEFPVMVAKVLSHVRDRR